MRRDKWDGASGSISLIVCLEQKCGFGGKMGYWYRALLEEQKIMVRRIFWRVPRYRYRFVIERFFIDWEPLDQGEWTENRDEAEMQGRLYLNEFRCHLTEDGQAEPAYQ